MMALLHKKGLLLVALLLTGIVGRGQEPRPGTVHLTQTSYADLLKELEKQTGYRFFYDTTDFDTTKIDINVDRAPMDKVLDQVFAGTEISYSVTRHQHVFVARGEAIHTDLPPGYFDKPGEKGALAGSDTVRDYLAEAGKR